MNEQLNITNETENDDNIIRVGFKNTDAYVLYALNKFLLYGSKNIVLEARGINIPKSIVIAGILKNNYIRDLNFRISIGSQLLENQYVPTIQINCSKFAYIM
jgi:DNA-binding protein Alba